MNSIFRVIFIVQFIIVRYIWWLKSISLPTGKLYKKPEKIKLKNGPAASVGKFYRNLAENVDTFLGSDFYGWITNDVDILSEDLQKYILATSDFAKGMQTDINHYVTKDRLNNALKF